jgi:hypothetical protein
MWQQLAAAAMNSTTNNGVPADAGGASMFTPYIDNSSFVVTGKGGKVSTSQSASAGTPDMSAAGIGGSGGNATIYILGGVAAFLALALAIRK